MTFRDMNLAVFAREPVPQVLFQPRFEPWVAWNRQFDSLPERCRGKSVREIYDAAECSMRYIDYYTGQPSAIEQGFSDEVHTEVVETGDTRVTHYQTPHGTLTQTQRFSVDRVWRTIDYPGKSTDDLPALKWLVQRRVFRFRADHFAAGDAFIGDRGFPQFYVPKSPYLAMAQQWMNFQPFIYAMYDAPEEMREIMRVIDDSQDALYEQLTSQGGAVRIINYGENIAEAHLSPMYFEEYLLPWYNKRVKQLQAAGIYCHIHIDGNFKSLIPHIRQLPHDGLEALTPKPQGDVTLDEMAEALGDKILLDGIPAVLFLDHHSRDALQTCVEQVVNRFAPRLILGISDELPEAATEEGFERLEWVANYARKHRGAGGA